MKIGKVSEKIKQSYVRATFQLRFVEFAKETELCSMTARTLNFGLSNLFKKFATKMANYMLVETTSRR